MQGQLVYAEAEGVASHLTNPSNPWEGSYAEMVLSSQAKWSSCVTVSPSPILEEQPFLRFTFAVELKLERSANVWGVESFAYAAVSATDEWTRSSVSLSELIYGGGPTVGGDIPPSFTLDVSVRPSESGYSGVWRADAFTSSTSYTKTSSDAHAYAEASLRLVSVTLPDGSTPEFLEFCGLSTDIAPTSLARDDKGGVDFGYEVRQSPLTKGTSVSLYWSADDKFDPGTDTPTGYSIAAQRAVGTHGPFHVDASALGAPPQGATHLLVVADPPSERKPSGEVAESDEGNNVKAVEVKAIEIGKPDLEPTNLSTRYLNDPASLASLPGIVTSFNPEDFALEAKAEITNHGPAPSGPFQVIFYAGARPDTKQGDPDFRVISAPISVASLGAGATTEVKANIDNPATLLLYTDHYYVGVLVDSDRKVDESEESNNSLSRDQCPDDAVAFSTTMHNLAGIWEALLLPTASGNLLRYLDGDGTTHTHQPSSPTSYNILASREFSLTDALARRELESLLAQNPTSGSISNLDVPVTRRLSYTSVSQIVTDGLDLMLGIGGTQANGTGAFASGNFSGNVRALTVFGRTTLIYDGHIKYTFRDKYEFDDGDVRKSGFDFMGRLLANCGVAKPFDANYEVVVPARGVIYLGQVGGTSLRVGGNAPPQSNELFAQVPPVSRQAAIELIAAQAVEAAKKKNKR